MRNSKTTKTELREEFYHQALDVIDDEIYDIVIDGGFTPDDFANAAANIFSNMLTRGYSAWILKKELPSIYAMGYTWKVVNYPGMVSCSDDDKTGVSRSLACVFSSVYQYDKDDDVRIVLDMMNEAWYNMQNNL